NFSVTFTSANPGEVDGHASTSFVLNGVTLTRSTGDSKSGDSGDAIKFFEDANISITPGLDSNEIGQPHIFTVTVNQNDGKGGGFVPAPGRPVTVTLANFNGAVALPPGPFSGTTDANGQFTVTFNSPTAGEVIGHASTSFVL